MSIFYGMTFLEAVGFTLWLWIVIHSACLGAILTAFHIWQDAKKQVAAAIRKAGERDELVH